MTAQAAARRSRSGVRVAAPVTEHLLVRRRQVVQDGGDELVGIEAGGLGASGAGMVEDLAGGLVDGQALQHDRAADHVAAEAGGVLASGDAGGAVHGEFMFCRT